MHFEGQKQSNCGHGSQKEQIIFVGCEGTTTRTGKDELRKQFTKAHLG